MTLTCVDCKRVYQDHVTVLPGSPCNGFGRCQKCRAIKGAKNNLSAEGRANRAWQKAFVSREASR